MSTPQTELPPRPPRTPGERVLICSSVLCVPATILLALRSTNSIESSQILDAVILSPFAELLLGIILIQYEKMQGKFPPK